MVMDKLLVNIKGANTSSNANVLQMTQRPTL
jgi:hypothetical protein